MWFSGQMIGSWLTQTMNHEKSYLLHPYPSLWRILRKSQNQIQGFCSGSIFQLRFTLWLQISNFSKFPSKKEQNMTKYKVITWFRHVADVVEVLNQFEQFWWMWKSRLCKPLQFVWWKLQWHLWKYRGGVFLEFQNNFSIGFMDELCGPVILIDFRKFLESQKKLQESHHKLVDRICTPETPQNLNRNLHIVWEFEEE